MSYAPITPCGTGAGIPFAHHGRRALARRLRRPVRASYRRVPPSPGSWAPAIPCDERPGAFRQPGNARALPFRPWRSLLVHAGTRGAPYYLTRYFTVRLVWCPALSVAVTVNLPLTFRDVSSGRPFSTVPTHDSTPDHRSAHV